MPAEILKYMPQQWVGLLAILMFVTYLTFQLVEKYPAIAKLLPFGERWHERARKKNRKVLEAVEDNEVIAELQRQIEAMGEQARRLRDELGLLQETIAALRSWSAYDASWHHRVSVLNAVNDACSLPPHYDFLRFERVWRSDPAAAARLWDVT